MDWGDNLQGVKQLYDPSQQPTKTTGETAGTAGSVVGGDSAPPADPRGAEVSTAAAPPPVTDPRGETGGEQGGDQGNPRGAGSQSTADDDPYTRAKEFIAKQKEKFVEDIKLKIGKEMLAYDSIRAHTARVTAPINGGSGVPALDGMVAMGERRILASSLKFDMKSKRIVSTSFKDDWTCLHCGSHGTKPAFKKRGEAGTGSGEQAVVLSDQCFPPILPTNGGEKCLKILRVEDGSILDLVDEFMKALGNHLFPQAQSS
jgi:hypothetical protein